jgi:hypothetical protein
VRLTDCTANQCCKVEIKYRGVWGTISSPKQEPDSQTLDRVSKTASVICRKAGCSGDNAQISPLHGLTAGHIDGNAWLPSHMIWMSVLDLNCTGTESDIVPCMSKKWGAGDGNYGLGAGSDFEDPHDGDFGVCCAGGCVGTVPPSQQVSKRDPVTLSTQKAWQMYRVAAACVSLSIYALHAAVYHPPTPRSPLVCAL